MAAVVLYAALSVFTASIVQTASAQHHQYAGHHRPYPTPIAQGCALCRGTSNCSQAVNNETAGVYCGDLITTFQPCCCQFRNECMTTIFSERCECLTGEEVEDFMSARFTIFLIFTVIMWAVLIWDRMCGRPYKVMNSNRHHMLADSPSVARIAGDAAPRETASDQELLEIDHRDEEAGGAAPSDGEVQAQSTDATSPRRNEPPANEARDDGSSEVVLELRDAPPSPRTRTGSSIQSV